MTDAEQNPEVTDLLRRWRAGEEGAEEKALALVYEELHRIADGYFQQERQNHTLQPTAVVHEAYLRLRRQALPAWEDRTHFLGIAARLMRQILVDHARRRQREKRGGGAPVLPLLEASDLAVDTPFGVLALDDSLERLARDDPQKASVVELRFFGGLDNREVADLLGISVATVVRQWRRARARLYAELSAGD